MDYHADSQETWSDEHDCDDIPCPTYGDNCPWNTAQDIRHEVDVINGLGRNGSQVDGWLTYAGNLAYWINPCVDDCESEY
jgi:hypothetical protein